MRVIMMMCGLLVLSGCMASAPQHWQHKSIPSSEWRGDERACKRAVDRYLGRNSTYHADQSLSTYDERMRVYEVGKKQKKLVADCMRKKGYVPID